MLHSRSDLDHRIRKILKLNQERLDVSCSADNDIPGLLEDLILNCFKKYGQRVVVLVDEYDKPILDNIENPETAAQMRALVPFDCVLIGSNFNILEVSCVTFVIINY